MYVVRKEENLYIILKEKVIEDINGTEVTILENIGKYTIQDLERRKQVSENSVAELTAMLGAIAAYDLEHE